MKIDRTYPVHLLTALLLSFWLSMGIERWAGFPAFGLNAMLAGTADRPFIYRVLAPAIVNLLARVMSPAAAVFSLQLMACLLFSLVMWELSALVEHRRLAWGMSVLGVFMLYSQMVHIYDMPVLALWTLALLLIVRRQWVWLLPVFGLACLAKETALLMVPMFAAITYDWQDALEDRWWRGIVGCMLAIWLAVRIWAIVQFGDNAGANMEIHLAEQLRSLPEYLFALAMLTILLVPSWTRQPEVLRRGILIFPVFAILFLIGGMPGEFRVFGEIYPVLVLMIAQSYPAPLPASSTWASRSRIGDRE